jgi:DNA repair photolyase
MTQTNSSRGAAGACPIGCRYCVITQVGYRADTWRKKFLIGLNKVVTILNPPPDKHTEALRSFYNFPLELLEGDCVGFNAISDPFWPKYRPELEWFLEHVPPIAKAVSCVTKFPVSERMMRRIADVPNFQLIVSVTGLDMIEQGTTTSRLHTLALAKQYDVTAFPIIHPYISGITDLSFLPKLARLGYDAVDVKGLRYDRSMDAWMPESVRRHYTGTEGYEVLAEDGWRGRIADIGLGLTPLRVWSARNMRDTPRLSRDEAEKRVLSLLSYANITSSDSDAEVIEAAIRRRL